MRYGTVCWYGWFVRHDAPPRLGGHQRMPTARVRRAPEALWPLVPCGTLSTGGRTARHAAREQHGEQGKGKGRVRPSRSDRAPSARVGRTERGVDRRHRTQATGLRRTGISRRRTTRRRQRTTGARNAPEPRNAPVPCASCAVRAGCSRYGVNFSDKLICRVYRTYRGGRHGGRGGGR